MTGDSTDEQREPVDGETPEPPLSWSVRPCARSPLLAVSVAVFILALSLAVQIHFGGAWWGLLTLVLLGLAVLPFYAATSYELSDDGVTVRGPVATYRRPWLEVRSVYPDADGVLLSPLAKPSRLALTRGLYVHFGDNRDEVLRRVEARAGQRAEDDGESGGAAGGE